MTQWQHVLFGAIGLSAIATGCAPHNLAADPMDARTERLANSAFGLLRITGFSHAFVIPDCGPVDGPAISVYLSDTPQQVVPPAGNYIRLTVWLDAVVNRRRTFDWSEGRGPVLENFVLLDRVQV